MQSQQKKRSLKTKLLKKLKRRARKVCHVRAFIKDKRPYYTIEVMQDCPHIYSKKNGVLLFGTPNKEEAIEEMDYVRRQWILHQIAQCRLHIGLVNINKELAKL
jgi:hypothetical protein